MRCRFERVAASFGRRRRRASSGRLAAGLAASFVAGLGLVAGCDLLTDPFATNDFSGDPFAIPVDTSSGAVTLFARGEGVDEGPALVDVMAPVSILDPRSPSAQPRIETRSIALLSSLDRTQRARLTGSLIELHPCDAGVDDPAQRQDNCPVGGEGREQEISLTIGADLLAGDALRLELQQSRLFLFPDIAGTNSDRSDACDAVFPEPFRGGGTLLIGGTEVPYLGRRLVLPACAAPVEVAPLDPPLPPPDALLPRWAGWAAAAKAAPAPSPRAVPTQRGVDLLLVASTSIPETLLSEAAYRRYLLSVMPADQVDAFLAGLPAGHVTLLSGEVSGRRATLPSLALVGKSTERGACGDVYAHRYLTRDDNLNPPAMQPLEEEDKDGVISTCQPGEIDCPCDRLPCGAPSIVELAGTGAAQLNILVIADDTPILVGLRTELRPDEAEVDGVIGNEIFARLSFDIDYPNNRVLARCAGSIPDASCLARPELPNFDYGQRMTCCLRPACPVNTIRGPNCMCTPIVAESASPR
jgi:hypothetical protein